MEATLENVFSSGEFGAEAEVNGGLEDEEPCVPEIDPEEVNRPEFNRWYLSIERRIQNQKICNQFIKLQPVYRAEGILNFQQSKVKVTDILNN